jgi:hypothetical protein
VPAAGTAPSNLAIGRWYSDAQRCLEPEQNRMRCRVVSCNFQPDAGLRWKSLQDRAGDVFTNSKVSATRVLRLAICRRTVAFLCTDRPEPSDESADYLKDIFMRARSRQIGSVTTTSRLNTSPRAGLVYTGSTVRTGLSAGVHRLNTTDVPASSAHMPHRGLCCWTGDWLRRWVLTARDFPKPDLLSRPTGG